jgi:hypothetical protein
MELLHKNKTAKFKGILSKTSGLPGRFMEELDANCPTIVYLMQSGVGIAIEVDTKKSVPQFQSLIAKSKQSKFVRLDEIKIK